MTSMRPCDCTALDLGALRHVGLHDRVSAELELFGQRLKPVEAARAQHQFRPVLRQPPGGGFAEPAARSGDDDDFVLDALAHGPSFLLARA
jgi:hypothetical protein